MAARSRRFMRVLHEVVMDRIKTVQEGMPKARRR